MIEGFRHHRSIEGLLKGCLKCQSKQLFSNTIVSQYKLFIHYNSAMIITNYCSNNQLKAISLVESDPWLKDRYLRVTHHEMSLKPLETAEKVYSFTGTTLTNHINEYVRNITEAKSDGSKHAAKKA